MTAKADALLAVEFSVKRLEARATLRKHMDERGLLEKDGWKIAEVLRQREGKTELVMRPIHLRLLPPDDLVCIVAIDDVGSQIDSTCTEDGAPLLSAIAR